MQSVDLPSTSINFLCDRDTIHQLLSTFRAVRRHSVNFCLLSVRPEDLLPTCRLTGRPSVNFSEVSVQTEDLPSTSGYFLCGRETFRKLSSTFRAIGRTSVNFCAARRHSVDNPCACVNFRQLPSMFRAAKSLPSTSLNFPCRWETFCHLCQLSVLTGEIPTTSVNFPCGCETFLQLPSPFRAARRPSVINGRSPSRTES